MTEAFVHKQLDKLTSDTHRRTLYGIYEDSKRLEVHCDFSQDLAHAQAEQSMCEYFDIISSSLFIAIAHFWDPVTKKRECEGTKLTIVLYISSSTRSFWCMQQNNVCFLVCQVGFSYPTILFILTTKSIIIYSRFMSTMMYACYVQNDFGHIGVLTVWADNCSEQFKSRYQLGWSVLYVNKTSLQIIHLFFFCPQHGKGPPDGLGGNCKNAIKAEEKFRRHLPAAIDVFLWLQQNFTAVHSPGTGLFAIRKRIFCFVPNRIVPRHHIIESTEFAGISNFYAFAVAKGAPI